MKNKLYKILSPRSRDKSAKKIKTSKQLLDEAEHDIMNYQNRALSFLSKPKAEANNTDTWFKNSCCQLLPKTEFDTSLWVSRKMRALHRRRAWKVSTTGIKYHRYLVIMSTSHTIFYWLNALYQSDFLILSVMFNNL